MSSIREYRVPATSGPKGLKLQNVSKPKPRGNEVLVRIHAVSVQYRDVAITHGFSPFPLKENPVPCSDAAGEIVEVGVDVQGWKKGDRVCANFSVDLIAGNQTEESNDTSLGGPIDGVLTEYKALPEHCLVHIPEHLSYEEASTLPCAGVTAYNALNGPVSVKGGDYVLIQGTGGVSIFALQFAVAMGAVVIATSSSDEKLQLSKKLGATHLINYKKTPEWDQEVMKITNGLGVDHVVEVGGVGTVSKSLNCIRFGGWVHQIGGVSKDQAAQTSIAMQCLSRAAVLRGLIVGSRHQFEAMNRFIAAIHLRPIVDKVFSFDRAPEAFEYLERQAHMGKVVIKVSASDE